ncbi:MAG: hypothetical protein KAR65_08130, partial [Anaerolineales bacterium]|nr:hypothetical protein [Anaerolineales bacterium]
NVISWQRSYQLAEGLPVSIAHSQEFDNATIPGETAGTRPFSRLLNGKKEPLPTGLISIRICAKIRPCKLG